MARRRVSSDAVAVLHLFQGLVPPGGVGRYNVAHSHAPQHQRNPTEVPAAHVGVPWPVVVSNRPPSNTVRVRSWTLHRLSMHPPRPTTQAPSAMQTCSPDRHPKQGAVWWHTCRNQHDNIKARRNCTEHNIEQSSQATTQKARSAVHAWCSEPLPESLGPGSDKRADEYAHAQ